MAFVQNPFLRLFGLQPPVPTAQQPVAQQPVSQGAFAQQQANAAQAALPPTFIPAAQPLTQGEQTAFAAQQQANQVQTPEQGFSFFNPGGGFNPAVNQALQAFNTLGMGIGGDVAQNLGALNQATLQNQAVAQRTQQAQIAQNALARTATQTVTPAPAPANLAGGLGAGVGGPAPQQAGPSALALTQTGTAFPAATQQRQAGQQRPLPVSPASAPAAPAGQPGLAQTFTGQIPVQPTDTLAGLTGQQEPRIQQIIAQQIQNQRSIQEGQLAANRDQRAAQLQSLRAATARGPAPSRKQLAGPNLQFVFDPATGAIEDSGVFVQDAQSEPRIVQDVNGVPHLLPAGEIKAVPIDFGKAVVASIEQAPVAFASAFNAAKDQTLVRLSSIISEDAFAKIETFWGTSQGRLKPLSILPGLFPDDPSLVPLIQGLLAQEMKTASSGGAGVDFSKMSPADLDNWLDQAARERVSLHPDEDIEDVKAQILERLRSFGFAAQFIGPTLPPNFQQGGQLAPQPQSNAGASFN